MRTKKLVVIISLLLAGLLFLVPIWVKGSSEAKPESAKSSITSMVEKKAEHDQPTDQRHVASDTEKDSASQVSKSTTGESYGSSKGEKSVPANAPSAGTAPKKVQYIISKNYGHQILANKQVGFRDNLTVMDGLLDAGLEVETSFEGSFVSSIAGLKTEGGTARKDWLYYVNGIFADVGALDYILQTGETIWWDFHPWKSSQGTPAVIGCFPEPFLHGFRGKVSRTVIIPVSENDTVQARKLQKTLQAYGVSAMVDESADIAARKGPTIVIGDWKKLEEIPWLMDFNRAYQRNGTFVHFSDAGLELLDYKGDTARTIRDSAGVLYATGQGGGDACPLWVLTGTDTSGKEAAVNILISHPEKIKAAFSAVVYSGEINKLPVMR